MTEAARDKISNMTFSVPERLKKRAQARPDVNWSSVVAQAIEERLNGLEILDRIASRTHLTEKDVDELADLVDSAMAEHFGVRRA
jgi:UDP-N-acetylenolpyruvoylglucosamine reductase